MKLLKIITWAETAKSRRARARALASHGDWSAKVLPYLRQVANHLATAGTLPEHRFVKKEDPAPRLQYFRIEGKIVHSGSASSNLKDWPSKLEYAIAPSGAVTVSLYAHRIGSPATVAEPFVIAIYNSAGKLCGPLGRHRVGNHVRNFLKLSNLSLSLVPAHRSRKFIETLDNNHTEFQRAFRTRKEHREKTDGMNIGIGLGVTAGLFPLIFSNLLPAWGEFAKRKADSHFKNCGTPPLKAKAGCLQDPIYILNENLAEALSMGWVQLVALLVCMMLLLKLRKYY